jgi:hypothetical protein
MNVRSFLLLLSIALCHSAEAATYARFNHASCHIGHYADAVKYLGKSYKTLPMEFLLKSNSGGSVKHEIFWEGLDDTLKYFNLSEKNVEAISFSAYKQQIVSVRIHFSEQFIESGADDINRLMNSCGKRMSLNCSIHNKDVELIIQNENTIAIQYSRAMARMYGYPLKNSYPCAP